MNTCITLDKSTSTNLEENQVYDGIQIWIMGVHNNVLDPAPESEGNLASEGGRPLMCTYVDQGTQIQLSIE